jgi:hypothetical protein
MTGGPRSGAIWPKVASRFPQQPTAEAITVCRPIAGQDSCVAAKKPGTEHIRKPSDHDEYKAWAKDKSWPKWLFNEKGKK